MTDDSPSPLAPWRLVLWTVVALAASWPSWAAGGDAPATVTPGVSAPLYPTDLPAPATLRYALKRGWFSGEGELRWAPVPSSGRYELSLQGNVAGLRLLQLSSNGTLDAHGLAPQRFTDQRGRGAAQSATFERDKGTISFSGAATEDVPWAPGAQDRLSWMLQLPAVLRAEPQRALVGRAVELYVVGARGDAAVCTFRLLAVEPVRTGAGVVPNAAKWVREPRKPRDTLVEVWLDPDHAHLPVRARLGGGEGDDALELLLQSTPSPPPTDSAP